MLNDRTQKILRAIVQSYIERPDPVGSRYVTKKYALDLSPATIRNIMADLEEMGFLTQPHTSAGRVPTDKGYRFYVDAFCAGDECSDEHALGVLNRKLRDIRNDLDALLRETTRTPVIAPRHCTVPRGLQTRPNARLCMSYGPPSAGN